MEVCFGSPFQYLPKESVTRDEFTCMLGRAITAGTADNLKGSADPYSDEGGSKWTTIIYTAAASSLLMVLF